MLMALVLATAVALAAGCGDDPQDTAGAATSAAATSAGPAKSPSVDAKANTEAMCKAIEAVLDAEKNAVLEALTEMLSATAEGNKDAQMKALAKAEAIMARVRKGIEPELAKAADPQAKAAIESYLAAFAKMMRPESLENPTTEAELEKAEAEAKKYCPTLTE
jgi:hypothetical protein